jgi:hypothetical protein
MIQIITVLIITILSLLLVYQPKLDWNYETKQLLLWYNSNNERKYIVLW